MTPRRMSTLLAQPARLAVIEDVTARDARRLARYETLTRALVCGEITPRTFCQTVRKWAPFHEFHFLADPEAVIAILEERRWSEPYVLPEKYPQDEQ